MKKQKSNKKTSKRENEQNNDEHFWILTPSSSRGDGSIDVFIDEPSFKGGAKKEKKSDSITSLTHHAHLDFTKSQHHGNPNKW